MEHNHKLFDKDTVRALRGIFSSLKKSLVNYLVVASDPSKCASCSEAEHLAYELMSITSNNIVFRKIEFSEDVREKLYVRYLPAFIYDTKKRNIRYYGLPSGQEFAPFIYIHKYIANNELTISKEILELVEEIDKPLHIKVFVTPECPYCPYVVDSVNQMGLVNDLLLVEAIEAMEFPQEADMYRVTYVPTIVVNKLSDWREYGAEPLEVIYGYVSPEELARVINNVSKSMK